VVARDSARHAAVRAAPADAARPGASGEAELRRQADVALAAGRWQEAIESLRHLARQRPRDQAAGRDLVSALERSGRDAEAAGFLAERPWLYLSAGLPAAPAIKAGKPGPEGMRMRSESLIATAQAQTAATGGRCAICHHREPALYGPAITRLLFPDRDTLAHALALRRAAAGERPSPLDRLRIGQITFYLATLYPPQHPEAKAYMARARRELEGAVRAAPHDANAWAALGLARHKLGEAAGAATAWRRALGLSPGQEEARVNLANLLQSQGRDPEAAALYREGLVRLSKSSSLWTNYGALLWKTGQYPAAIAAQQEALRLKPGDPVALLNLGLALKATGDLEGAEAALRESIRRRPSGALAHNALGALLVARGDWNGAASSFAEAARANPGLAAAHANLGRACERLGRWREAADAYRQAILCDPGRAALWERVAENRARAGDVEGAAEAGEKFRARQSRRPQAQRTGLATYD
jgi:tetratricopeptide (TPR) repeat protein